MASNSLGVPTTGCSEHRLAENCAVADPDSIGIVGRVVLVVELDEVEVVAGGNLGAGLTALGWLAGLGEEHPASTMAATATNVMHLTPRCAGLRLMPGTVPSGSLSGRWRKLQQAVLIEREMTPDSAAG